MVSLSPEQVFLAVEPVDMRLGVHGLSLRVQESLNKAPSDASAYAFRNKYGNRIKLLIWDGSVVWCCARRRHKGRFTWPQTNDTVFTQNHDDWQWLTTGLDWRRLIAPPETQWVCVQRLP